jgi:DNA polymerase III epsilon subunit-like protein
VQAASSRDQVPVASEQELRAVSAVLREIEKRCPNQKLPKSYMVFDTETSGTSPVHDKVLEWGWAAVINTVLHRYGSLYVCHTKVDIHPEATEVHGLTAEFLKEAGIPNEDALDVMLDGLNTNRKCGNMFVGHNAFKFDAEFLLKHTKEIGQPWKFEPNEILDTGIIVKAAKLNENMRSDENLSQFYSRIGQVYSTVKWSLDRYCYAAYELGSRSGIDRSKAHNAGVDCALTHYLLETMREKCPLS